jgi:hypothetical protein
MPWRLAPTGLDDRGIRGGYTLSFWVADAATGGGKEFWHNAKDDKDFTSVNAIQWADADHVIFQAEPQGLGAVVFDRSLERATATPPC